MADILRGIVADLSGIGSTLPQWEQLSLQRAQLAQQERANQEKADLNALGMIGKYDPTNTMWDVQANKRIQDATNAYMQAKKANPSAKASELLSLDEVRNPLKEIQQYTPVAIVNDKQRVELMKRAKEENPELDDIAFGQYVMGKQYADGIPVPNWMDAVDISPQALGNFILPEKALQSQAKALQSTLKQEPYQVLGDPNKGEFDYTHYVYPFQKVEGNKVITPKTRITFEGKDYDLINDEVAQFMDRESPKYYSLYNQELKKAQSQVPSFERFDEEDKRRYVEARMWDRLEAALPKKKEVMSDARIQEARRARNEERAIRAQNESLAMQRERLAIAKRKAEKDLKEDKNSPSGLYYSMVAGTLHEDGKPIDTDAEETLRKRFGTRFETNARSAESSAANKAFEAIKNQLPNETKIAINKVKDKNGNIPFSALNGALKVIDYSLTTPKGMFYDKESGIPKPYKLIAISDEISGGAPKMVKVYYNIEKDPEAKTDVATVTNAIAIDDDAIADELFKIEDQVKGTKQQIKEQQIFPLLNDIE